MVFELFTQTTFTKLCKQSDDVIVEPEKVGEGRGEILKSGMSRDRKCSRLSLTRTLDKLDFY